MTRSPLSHYRLNAETYGPSSARSHALDPTGAPAPSAPPRPARRPLMLASSGASTPPPMDPSPPLLTCTIAASAPTHPIHPTHPPTQRDGQHGRSWWRRGWWGFVTRVATSGVRGRRAAWAAGGVRRRGSTNSWGARGATRSRAHAASARACAVLGFQHRPSASDHVGRLDAASSTPRPLVGLGGAHAPTTHRGSLRCCRRVDAGQPTRTPLAGRSVITSLAVSTSRRDCFASLSSWRATRCLARGRGRARQRPTGVLPVQAALIAPYNRPTSALLALAGPTRLAFALAVSPKGRSRSRRLAPAASWARAPKSSPPGCGWRRRRIEPSSRCVGLVRGGGDSSRIHFIIAVVERRPGHPLRRAAAAPEHFVGRALRIIPISPIGRGDLVAVRVALGPIDPTGRPRPRCLGEP